MKFFTRRRVIVPVIVAVAGFVTGRLALRAVGNLLLGGTLFGGNIL